ncbi:MAG: hypothetical protein IH874_05770 [Candidatus Dadabacteria bacterium]|nr:hypothetical protein [Candidatus Dadabacteria bacterium]
MRTTGLFLATAVIIALSSGCTQKWKDPEVAMLAREMDITAILLDPIIYDSAALVVKGMVWDVSTEKMTAGDVEVEYTIFKLADRDGNYVGVFSLGHLDVNEGDRLKVTGIYRRRMETAYYNFRNDIEAMLVEED